MDTIEKTYNYKIGCTLLIILISALMFGIIFFCTRKARIRPAIKQHTIICKYMGMEFEETNNFAPDFGYIPSLYNIKHHIVETPEIAANIGITILSSVYGRRMSELQKPYNVSLINGEVWEVKGSLPYKDFYILIQMSDCRVLSISGYSYIEYLTRKGFSKENTTPTGFIDDAAYIWISNGNALLYDFINNDSKIPHSLLTYKYQGERHGYVLPFTRLSFKGYNYMEEDEYFPATHEWMSDNGYTPDSSVRDLPNGVLRDYETAAKVGIIILSSIYKEERIKRKKPFEIFLRNADYWALICSLYLKGAFGGAAYINIQKADCRVLSVYHEKL